MEKIPNFHEISEKRKEHKKALNELGEENGLEKKFLSTKLESFDKKAKGFKVADYGGIGKAVDFMRQERAEAEEELLAVDLEAEWHGGGNSGARSRVRRRQERGVR